MKSIIDNIMSSNRTWLAFANKKRCRHADAIHSLGFISWRMGRAHFSIDDVVYLFKLKVVEENSKREYQSFWGETPPNDITYKLKLLGEYDGRMLSEQNLCKHGFKGGRSLETPSCNNTELINYIKSVF